MTLPRFTADPVPDISGLSETEALRVIREYIHESLTRIDDYWPKDLEARIAALEKLFPFIGGDWNIADFAKVTLTDFVEQDIEVYVFIGSQPNVCCGGWTRSYSGYDDFRTLNVDAEGWQTFRVDSDTKGTFACAASEDIIYSTDGENWTDATDPWTITGKPIGGIIWEPTTKRWIASMHHPDNGLSEVGIYIRATTDFTNWTTLYENNSTSVSTYRIAHDGMGNIMCNPTTHRAGFLYSNDGGDNWAWNSTVSWGNEFTAWVSYAHDRWYMGCFDGELWMCDPGTSFTLQGNWSRVIQGAAGDFGGPVYAGFNGAQKIYLHTAYWANTAGRMWYSTDGENFQTVPHPFGTWPLSEGSAIGFHETLGFIFVGEDQILKSTNGLTWTAAPDNGNYTFLKVVGVFERPSAP